MDFYSRLFTYEKSSFHYDVSLQDIHLPSLSSENYDFLIYPLTTEEVCIALKSIYPTKSPTHDGFHVIFYPKFWDVVGGDVLKVVMDFLNGYVDISFLNKTFLLLIPKVKDPKTIKEFQRISLCNVKYKLISKTTTNRLSSVLPSLIFESESAFVKNRLITDNAILAIEAFHIMKVGYPLTCDPYMAIKLDMMKAYDRMEWGFLQGILIKMGFLAR